MSAPCCFKQDEEYTMPCAEALLAGTLALMTAHIQTSSAEQRELFAGKIVSNLGSLSELSALSGSFKTMIRNLRGRWQQQTQLVQGMQGQGMQGQDREQHQWHNSPKAVQ
jgi:hypothetical protein